MTRFLGILSFLLVWGYGFVFFWIIKTFLPLRQNRIVKWAAYLAFVFIADTIVYSNDLDALLGAMAAFILYLLIFHRGTLLEKLSLLLMFYPALIAVNYLMLDVGGRLLKLYTHASFEQINRSPQLTLVGTAFHAVSLLLRLLFWVGAWLALRRFFPKLPLRLGAKTWLITDMLMLASFVAIFTIIYFMPEDAGIVYPICGASIFSSFGCMYLAAYLYGSFQTACRIQQLEIQCGYYKDRVRDEERVRGIYHDMKNHLLLLQAQAENRQEVKNSIQSLQEQIREYENYHRTGNEFLDIILRDKAKEAQERQIDFAAAVSFEDGTFLEPLDISTIFGNALDNAIEACDKLPPDRRLITVKAARIRDLLMISVENSILPGLPSPEGTTKEDAFAHGFGLPNIRKAVERYGGQCSVRAEDQRFVLKILIPIP